MNRKQKAQKIFSILNNEYPNATTALEFSSAWELLVATILSAQCTDVRVNKVTPKLFADYPSPQAINEMDIDILKDYIRSTGFYNNKAKNIKGSAKIVVEKYNGKVPDTMQELLKLPGVARKTANVVLGVWFKKTEGIVVDTHVKRLANRYGLTTKKNPEKIEKDLMKLFEKDQWTKLSMLFIAHGRKIATARNPKDELDVLKEFIV